MGLRNLTVAALLIMSFAIAAQGQGASLPPEYESAIEELESHQDQAEALMRAHQDVWLARLDLMLFLHSFRDARPERDAEIDNLSQLIAAEAWKQIPEESLARLPGMPPTYDGTSESLIPTVQLASLSDLATNRSTASYLIPCGILLKKPDLLVATAPMFGSGMDNYTPRSGCEWGRGEIRGFPTEAVEQFRNLADAADVIYNNATMSGSSRYGMAKRQSFAIEKIKLRDFKFTGGDYDPANLPSPYKSWGYLSLYNHQLEARIHGAYVTAMEGIARYIDRPLGEAFQGIGSALDSIAIGGCRNPDGSSLRELLLDGAPEEEIRKALAQITDIWSIESDVIKFCANEGEIAPDPIMHIAVARADLLPMIAAHSIVGGIDTRNDFGKTPLMTAAQFDLLPAVNWLIANKAEVTATTNATAEWDYIKHGERTALHYAAANASLPVIEALLKAGANPAAKDDEGATPLDYLNGKGPVSENKLLTGEDRRRATVLLGS